MHCLGSAVALLFVVWIGFDTLMQKLGLLKCEFELSLLAVFYVAITHSVIVWGMDGRGS